MANPQGDGAQHVNCSYQPAGRNSQLSPADTGCGCFSCQPSWARPLAHKYTYLLVYCSCGLVQGMWYTYFVSILSTVEKTFKFPSSTTGIILAGNDLAQIFFAVCISYYGGRGSRPRWVGAGMLMNALGCLLSALPHFVWGVNRQDITSALLANTAANSSVSVTAGDPALFSQSDNLCHAHGDTNSTAWAHETTCSDGDSGSLVPVVLLFASQFVSGIGATSYYTLGMTYLDDSVDKQNSPVIFAISAGLRVMGPMLGFLLGSFSLSRFVIPDLPVSFSQKDPRWIGAWWLGFFVLAVLLTVISVLMCQFPKMLPERYHKQQQQRQQPASADGLLLDAAIAGSTQDLHAGGTAVVNQASLTDLLTTLRRLLRNTLLVVMLINVVFAVIGFIGYFTFLPKYQQAVFKQSAARASLFSGLSGVLVTLVGYLLSGVVMKVFQPRALLVTSYGALVSGVQTACMFALMTIKCHEPDMHGQMDDQGRFQVASACNSHCECDPMTAMEPVCDAAGRFNYFSPCHAGCQTSSEFNGSTVFHNCSCVAELNSTTSATSWPSFDATSGTCDEPCSGFLTFIIILAVMKFIGSTNRTGGMLVFFRSVPDADKSLAMGMSTALLSIFCFIPAPIIFGAIVDSACQIWEYKPCGGRGNCLLYDADKLRIYLHTATIIAFGISFLLDLVVIYLARNIDLYGTGPQQRAKDARASQPRGAEDAEQRQPLK